MAGLNDLQRVGLVFSIGSIVIAGSILGFLSGYLLDKAFNSKPWLIVVFSALGIVIGFVQAYRISRRFFRE
jgi:F0F1-type ATP synthase assembly protein I